MQNEIKQECDVLGASGVVRTPGWCREPLFYFDKSLCKNRFTLTESDSYLIGNKDVSIYLCVAEKGVVAEVCALIIDHNTGSMDYRTLKNYMSFGRLSMPQSSKNGDVTFNSGRVGMNFSNTALNRYIRCEFVNFYKDKNLYINLELQEGSGESLNVLIPENPVGKGFFLKRFLPSMRVSGVVRLGGAEYHFSPDSSRAYLDWQRMSLGGKACYHALYADTDIDGHDFSLCLAGGVGDVSMGTENCYFLDGKIHKLASVKAVGSEDRPDKPWKFTAGNSALELQFRPTMKAGHLLSKKCGGKTFIFGKLFGTIQQMNTDRIVLDAVPAHLEFSII